MYKVHWWLRYPLCWSWQHVLRNCVVHIDLAEGKTSVVQSWILKVPLSTNWESELSLEPRSHSNHWPAGRKKCLELDTLVQASWCFMHTFLPKTEKMIWRKCCTLYIGIDETVLVQTHHRSFHVMCPCQKSWPDQGTCPETTALKVKEFEAAHRPTLTNSSSKLESRLEMQAT